MPVSRRGNTQRNALLDRLAQKVDQAVTDALVLNTGGREKQLHAITPSTALVGVV
jgi:hypothetical protein